MAKPTPRELGERFTLRDGTDVEVRPITPGSRERIRDGIRRMSPRSRYLRFLTPLRELSESQLRYLTDVDQLDHLAMGAVDPLAAGEPGLGVARCVRLRDEPSVAEAAVGIVDSHQGRGLGRLLLGVLARGARPRDLDAPRVRARGERADAPAPPPLRDGHPARGRRAPSVDLPLLGVTFLQPSVGFPAAGA